MQKRWSVLTVLAGAVLLFASCYPGEVTSVQQLDVVVTTHDDTVTFASFATYALLDSVVHIDGDTLGTEPDTLLDRTNDQLIIDEVRAGIEALGYVEVDPQIVDPDVVLLIAAFAVERDAYFSYGWWPYYGGYYGWPGYGNGWGWGYPPTGGVGSVSWTQGTVAILMLDPSRVGTPSNMEAPLLWVAGMNGVLSGSANTRAARIRTLIRQAYDQSPYLLAN